MIRRSAAIATAALVLSLVVHLLGLSLTVRIQPERSDESATNDVVALGNAFEDVAENLSDPVPPETTPPPEPERAEVPTSEALVASPDPQRTTRPDTGSARIVQPDTTEPSEPEQGRTPEPRTVEPSGGEQEPPTDATPPVEPETVARSPKGEPDTSAVPVEPVPVESLPGQPVAPALPVTPSPELSAVPTIPLERETVTAEPRETTVEPVPEEPGPETVEDDSGGSDLAVVASPRPRLAPRRPSKNPAGLPNGSEEFSELQFPPLIESPLSAYLRDKTDLVIRQDSAARSGGLGFDVSGRGGNSDVTNYAGKVLVHLNRAPAVRVSGRGSARVFFEINPDGTLAWVDVVDSTGSPELNSAAKAQVRSASPFPRPPKGASRRLTFVFSSN